MGYAGDDYTTDRPLLHHVTLPHHRVLPHQVENRHHKYMCSSGITVMGRSYPRCLSTYLLLGMEHVFVTSKAVSQRGREREEWERENFFVPISCNWLFIFMKCAFACLNFIISDLRKLTIFYEFPIYNGCFAPSFLESLYTIFSLFLSFFILLSLHFSNPELTNWYE